jgi:hypothetical protein
VEGLSRSGSPFGSIENTRQHASALTSPAHPPLTHTLKDTIERQARTAAGGAAATGAGGGNGAARKAARLERSLKNELIAVMAPIRLKQTAVGTAAAWGLFKGVLGRVGPSPVAVLPFQATAPPLSWLARRGLPADTPLNAAAATLLFALIQVGVRQTVAKLLDAGPTPRMAELQAQFGTEAGWGAGVAQGQQQGQAGGQAGQAPPAQAARQGGNRKKVK